LTEKRIHVFDTVRLVDDNVFPGKLLERALLSDAEFVGRDEDIEFLSENDTGDLLGLNDVS
jgi:hypothetical protein